MAQRAILKPWHEVLELRDDVKSGGLSLAVFAADLYDVVMQKGRRPVYEDPAEFFALTYPTYKLRELVKDVCLRLAGKSDKAYRKLSVNYGGGKTHTLITLRHLVHDPDSLPNLPSIQEFEAHIGFKPPRARVAALCFDKIDPEKGIETFDPNGESRMLRHPWSVLAFQLAGADGLRLIHAEGKDEERETPPAEPLMAELLSKPQQDGLSTLVLVDEVLMYLRGQAEDDSSSRGRLVNFFQSLTQAVVKVDRCAMVASLLASDPKKYDDFGREILRDVSEVFGRQMEEEVSPVSKEDVAEVLRRRFFKPEAIREPGAFRPHVTSVVGNIAALDEQTRKERQSAEDRYLDSYPFHPDLTEVFYTRWTQLDGFQRTRGILRTFAIALRDAEKWDTSPLVGPNVFLNEPGRDELVEAASELASFASVDGGTGGHQEWRPILEGELGKARAIQSEATGLQHREMEQAVVSVFLSSQPIGQKALTREIAVLVGATNPDKIELEKALHRWMELSWFLDEVEVNAVEASPDGTKQLPNAWRLGNRPNLRQMHDDACANRVRPALVESQLIDYIEKQRSLTSGAAAAGARVHNVPERPRDIEDDGQFHYAVLGSKAASESGKLSLEAKRFINETTAPDRPRVNRNAVVLAVPSREGLDIARSRIREYMAWLEVRELLKGQQVDPVREQMLASESEAARRRIPEAIRQAYSIVVTLNESNDIQAFRVAVNDDPLFVTIKADRRARIQETAISSEAMMPGGPYDLWREGEDSRRVKDLVGAFAQFAKLPKMLRHKEILDTVVHGVLDGIWVATLIRPDRTTKTFWRTGIEDHILSDSALEVFLPESATLSDIDPDLLSPQSLPGLWSTDEITVRDVTDYFAGGHSVTVPKEGYDDTVFIPQCQPALVEQAIAEAVQRGVIWLINGPASILNEPVPVGVLGPSATLHSPPGYVTVQALTAESIPEAWKDGKTNALAIITALSAQSGKTLPWSTVQSAIDSGIRARWIELSPDSSPWPCDLAGAQHVVIQAPKPRQIAEGQEHRTQKRLGTLTAEAILEAHGIQDLADQIPGITGAAVGNDLKFSIRIEFGGDDVPDPAVVEAINSLLSAVSEDLKLH